MPVKQLKHNPAKVQPVTPALQALLSKDAELKASSGRGRMAFAWTCMRPTTRQIASTTLHSQAA